MAIINQAAAQKLFPGEDPIGKHLVIQWTWVEDAEIIGVAADVRHNGLENTPAPCPFLSHAQTPSLFAALVIRTQGDAASAASAVREQIRAVDPHQGTLEIKPMERILSDSIARPKLDLTVLGIFGVLALSLASIGIYAVMSYSVEQRRREMGIRLALGAVPRAILGLVLREALMLAAVGIVAGALGALALTRYLSTLLYSVRPTDPMVFSAVGAVLAAAALAGCYLPALRGTRVDPAIALREE